uniref:Malectin-like domain-containing protein n=1 Tax=Nelumbo nucifera TaxID=4432 RepID=A0A822XU60_NELNU|nr:TPA_asm: hypothetical protein HUJ06_025383 [Nelumbo nucifera]
MGPRQQVCPPGSAQISDSLHLCSFSLEGCIHRKFCYVLPVTPNVNYLVRPTYFYGGINGIDLPPVFDQRVGGMFWSIVNTTKDYTTGRWSYYEGVFVACGWEDDEHLCCWKYVQIQTHLFMLWKLFVWTLIFFFCFSFLKFETPRNSRELMIIVIHRILEV